MLQVDRPLRRRRARSVRRGRRSSTCTTPTTAGGLGRSRARTTRPGWSATGRAQRERVRAHRRARAQARSTRPAQRRAGLRDVEHGSDDWRVLRKRAVHLDYFTIYRTLADPAYLDPTIEPDDRPLGSLFAFPDPFDANYGRGGLARTMTSRGWLSTWSALSSQGSPRDHDARCHVPVLVVHPTADTEIRIRQAQRDRRGRGRRRRELRRAQGRAALPRGPPPRSHRDRRRLDPAPLPVGELRTAPRLRRAALCRKPRLAPFLAQQLGERPRLAPISRTTVG